nr:methyl-CpG-binding domain protein 2-like [Aegilops tauschii subsp. strangulata]
MGWSPEQRGPARLGRGTAGAASTQGGPGSRRPRRAGGVVPVRRGVARVAVQQILGGGAMEFGWRGKGRARWGSCAGRERAATVPRLGVVGRRRLERGRGGGGGSGLGGDGGAVGGRGAAVRSGQSEVRAE